MKLSTQRTSFIQMAFQATKRPLSLVAHPFIHRTSTQAHQANIMATDRNHIHEIVETATATNTMVILLNCRATHTRAATKINTIRLKNGAPSSLQSHEHPFETCTHVLVSGSSYCELLSGITNSLTL